MSGFNFFWAVLLLTTTTAYAQTQNPDDIYNLSCGSHQLDPCPSDELPALPQIEFIKIPQPDLIISALSSRTLNNGESVEHTITIKNIGDGDSEVGRTYTRNTVLIQFYATNTVAPTPQNDYRAAGGWQWAPPPAFTGDLEQMWIVPPGTEHTSVLSAGSISDPEDSYKNYSYIFARITAGPAADGVANNNISIAPLQMDE